MLVLFLLQLACVGYVGHVLWKRREELGHAFDLDAWHLIGLVALIAIGHVQRTFELTYMLRRLGVREPFGDGFMLTGAGFLLNQLPFNAGFVMRAAVLKRDHALSYSSYLSLVAVNALINLAVAAGLGLFAVVTSPGGNLALIVLFGLALIGSITVIWLPFVSRIPERNLLTRKLRNFANGVSMIRSHTPGLLLLFALAGVKVVVTGLRMWICLDAMGTPASPLAVALLGSTTVLVTLVNITPGNLGLRELALAFIAAQLGTSYAVGMAAASIDRIVFLGYTVVTGVPGIYALRKRGLFSPRAVPAPAPNVTPGVS